MGPQLDLYEQFERAKRTMEQRFAGGETHEKNLVETVAKTVIVDKLVSARAKTFMGGEALTLTYDGSNAHYTIHKHAFAQFCQKVSPSIPMAFANGLLVGDDRRRLLLATNLNELFSGNSWVDKNGQNQRFLHRIVGTEVRGFLSRRFNRHLASAPLLRAFLDQCKAQGARPIESASSPVRNSIKCLLPTVLEAYPGEYVCLGAEWTNSDFGAGRLRVSQTVWRVGAGTAAVLDEGLSKAHIGSIIEDSDVEMTDETAMAEMRAQQSAVRDCVKSYLSEKVAGRLLDAIRGARDHQISWSVLRTKLRDVINKSEFEWMQTAAKEAGIIDLPPISALSPDAQPDLYWASCALGILATKTEDADRKIQLQHEAGKLLLGGLAEV